MISRFFVLAAALNLSTAVLAQSSNTGHSAHQPASQRCGHRTDI